MSDETESEEVAGQRRALRFVGYGIMVAGVIVVGATAVSTDPGPLVVYGLLGLGVKLFLPYFMPASPAERAADTPNYGGNVRRTAAGIGLFTGGFVLFNARFVTEGFLIQLAAAAIVALALFVPLDRLLPAEPAST